MPTKKSESGWKQQPKKLLFKKVSADNEASYEAATAKPPRLAESRHGLPRVYRRIVAVFQCHYWSGNLLIGKQRESGGTLNADRERQASIFLNNTAIKLGPLT
jgi:hypothetical protein